MLCLGCCLEMVAWWSRGNTYLTAMHYMHQWWTQCHFRLSLKECETRARATQKQIESRLTRDLFAFRLSFLVKNQQNARARTFFFGKVCKCAFFFVSLQACRDKLKKSIVGNLFTNQRIRFCAVMGVKICDFVQFGGWKIAILCSLERFFLHIWKIFSIFATNFRMTSLTWRT